MVPGYNIALFVDKVLSSLLLKEVENDIEVLLVDDGSQDDTLEKARAYLPSHPTLRVVSKENGGHGSVINYGIRHAKGKYFKVVDGDDYVEAEGFVALVSHLKQTNADLVANPFYMVDQSTGRRQLRFKTKLMPGKVYPYDRISERMELVPIHALTIRTKLLNEHPITIAEKCYYDDFEYTMFPVPYVRSAVYFEEPVYDYLVGQPRQSVRHDVALKNIRMLWKILKESVAYAGAHTEASEAKAAVMENALAELLNNMYNVFLRNAFTKGTYRRFRQCRKQVQTHYRTIEQKTFSKYPHLVIAAKGRIWFYLVALLLNVYKRFRW